MSKRGHRAGHSHSQHEKSRRQKPTGKTYSVANESFDEKVSRLRAAVIAATTIGQFDDARAEIRRSLSMFQCDQTDLPETCEAKRKELGYELVFRPLESL